MKILRVLAVALLCCLLANCSRAPQPTPLFDGFMSYSSWMQIRSHPKLVGHKWDILQRPESRSSDLRPQMDYRLVQTNDYSYLGHKGYVKFSFYNEHLMSVEFEPQESSSYAKIQTYLEQKLKTKMLVHRDYDLGDANIRHNNHFFTWSDKSLIAEMHDWIAQNS